jgi:hypothetical protein
MKRLDEFDGEGVDEFIPILKVPEDTSNAIQLIADNPTDYQRLCSMLYTSFNTQFRAGQVYWPARFNSGQRGRLALQRIQRRLENETWHALLGLPSSIRGLSEGKQPGSLNPDDYGVDCGLGLYCTMDIRVNDVIAQFHGKFFEGVDEMKRRVENGLGKYILFVRQGYYMDCREAKANGTCKASYSNSPRLAMHIASGEFVCANCKLTISGPRDEKILRLVATRPIPRMTEILWNYSGHHAI